MLTTDDQNRIIEMAWEDRTPFEAIELQFGLNEKEVIALMRNAMKKSSWLMWRKRMSGRKTKHAKLQQTDYRFKCTLQKSVAFNKIAKR